MDVLESITGYITGKYSLGIGVVSGGNISSVFSESILVKLDPILSLSKPDPIYSLSKPDPTLSLSKSDPIFYYQNQLQYCHYPHPKN